MGFIYFYLFYAVVAAVVAGFGKDRKFGFWGYFFASLALTPFVGMLLVVASDDRPKMPPHA